MISPRKEEKKMKEIKNLLREWVKQDRESEHAE